MEKEEQLSAKELRNDFYKCRDFELSNLWQRSIFLSVFLVLCFTGYGFVLVKMTELEENHILALPILNIIAIIIGILSLLFSILWIMMGKGSKAWYEVYEAAICDIDKKEVLNIEDDYRMGELPIKRDLDHNIFTNKGGGFSVSKINIAIGQICFWIWSIVILFHSIFNIINIQLSLCVTCSLSLLLLLIISYILPIIAIIISCIFIFSDWLKSGYLRK